MNINVYSTSGSANLFCQNIVALFVSFFRGREERRVREGRSSEEWRRRGERGGEERWEVGR